MGMRAYNDGTTDDAIIINYNVENTYILPIIMYECCRVQGTHSNLGMTMTSTMDDLCSKKRIYLTKYDI